MTPPGDRAQDVGRKHSRRRRVEAAALTDQERAELVGATPLEAYARAITSASWLYAVDELTVVLLGQVLAELTPPAPAGESVLGGPMPAPVVPLGDRLRLWQLARDLAGELGLSADARRRIGLELTPPVPRVSPTGGVARSSRRPRVDFGGE